MQYSPAMRLGSCWAATADGCLASRCSAYILTALPACILRRSALVAATPTTSSASQRPTCAMARAPGWRIEQTRFDGDVGKRQPRPGLRAVTSAHSRTPPGHSRPSPMYETSVAARNTRERATRHSCKASIDGRSTMLDYYCSPPRHYLGIGRNNTTSLPCPAV